MVPFLRLVAAGAKRVLTTLAREVLDIAAGILAKPRRGQSPLSRAVRRIKQDFQPLFKQEITYDNARNLFYSAVNDARKVSREEGRQWDNIDRGLPPRPPATATEMRTSAEYVLKIALYNPDSGSTYWSTVYVSGHEGMTVLELQVLARRAALNRPDETRNFRRFRPNQEWENDKIIWIG